MVLPYFCSISFIHAAEIIEFIKPATVASHYVLCFVFTAPCMELPHIKSLSYSEAYFHLCGYSICCLCLLHPLPGIEQSITAYPGYIMLSAPAKNVCTVTEYFIQQVLSIPPLLAQDLCSLRSDCCDVHLLGEDAVTGLFQGAMLIGFLSLICIYSFH